MDGNGHVRLPHALRILSLGKKLLIADAYNHRVLELNPRQKTVKTVLGTAEPDQKDGRGRLLMRLQGKNSYRCRLLLLPVLTLLTVFAAPAPAQTKSNGSNVNDPITVSRFARAPVIDGKLDEDVWQKATGLKNFVQTQPGDNVPATHPTEVHLGYDEKNLYIAIQAFDEKGQVRATVAKRDDLSGNDYTAVWLDTFNDNRRAYVLLLNPIGIQADGIFTEGHGIDYSVDLVMESKGVLTSDGYTVEVQVPFSSLRYEIGRGKLWGVHILRAISHLDEWDSWMPLRRESRDFSTATFTQFLEQAGRITGIENVGDEHTLELIPNLTLAETGRRVRTQPRMITDANPALFDKGRFVNAPVKPAVGLTAKLTLTSGVTLGAALNPDFAQVEADQLVVTANQRFPIFFAEKRPFFLEGIEIFNTPIRAVHTRTIIDPDVAIKLAGKRKRNSFGLMFSSDNGPGTFSEDERHDPNLRSSIDRFIDKNSYVGVLRLKRDIGKESSIGVIATSYNFIEKHNQLFGFDGRFTVNPKTVFTFQVLGTNSRCYFYDADLNRSIYRTGNGLAYYLQLQLNTRHLNASLTGKGYTSDYRANVGFVSQTNTNPWDLLLSYNSEPKQDAQLISWTITSASRAQFDWQGRMRYAFESVRTQLNFKRQTYLKTDSYSDYQRLFEDEFGPRRTAMRQGTFFGASERSTVYKGLTFEAGTAPSKKYAAVISIDNSWRAFDFDLGAGPKFPRVSPAALLDPQAPLDPGPGKTLDISANLTWRPRDPLNISLSYIKSRLVRNDAKRVAFDQNLFSLKTTYQFTRFTFLRGRVDYDTLRSRVFGQFLLAWTPSPGTAFYAGYDDDLNRNGYNPFTGQYETGLRRNTRTFFIKLSYLFRRSI